MQAISTLEFDTSVEVRWVGASITSKANTVTISNTLSPSSPSLHVEAATRPFHDTYVSYYMKSASASAYISSGTYSTGKSATIDGRDMSGRTDPDDEEMDNRFRLNAPYRLKRASNQLRSKT